MFFGLDWLASLIKMSFRVVYGVVAGLVFWLCWTKYGLGAKYFSFVPELYQSIPYWNTVGLFIIIGFLGEFIGTLTPKIIKVDNSNTNGK